MNPVLTTLSYSGGKQSHALLEMVLRGHIPRPEPFLVLNADPGMENENSYPVVEAMRQRCEHAGIPFKTAHTSLKHDLLTFKERGLTHLDQPPYWTRNRVTGKKGRLKQKCTPYYKVAAMRRLLRIYLNGQFGTSLVTKRLPPVETWIGFAADELDRANGCKADRKFVTLRFPLVEMGFTKAKTIGYYLKHGIAEPPPSVCNACFANGLAFLEEMYVHRPDDWDEAVRVDEAIRDMRQIGIEDECFVSETLIPLREMPALNFKKDDIQFFREHKCNSGVCFT
jgi:hypothetical protein